MNPRSVIRVRNVVLLVAVVLLIAAAVFASPTPSAGASAILPTRSLSLLQASTLLPAALPMLEGKQSTDWSPLIKLSLSGRLSLLSHNSDIRGRGILLTANGLLSEIGLLELTGLNLNGRLRLNGTPNCQ
jgi:hypothetical protein